MTISKFFLEGFMGSGKSTFGKKLANALGWRFVDLDDYIEEQAGKTIVNIFEDHGEQYFRNLETKALEHSVGWTNTIVSCGGGTPCFNDNAARINELGYSIYLKLSAHTLKERLLGEKGKRPLVAKLSDEELLTFIENKLVEREPFYSKATQTFDYSDEEEKNFINELKLMIS